MFQALLDIDEVHRGKLDQQTRPGETRDAAIARLLIDGLDDVAAAATRSRIIERARHFSAALEAAGDHDAEVWAEALEWFARRIAGGQVGIAAHRELVRRFAVEPDDQRAVEPEEVDEMEAPVPGSMGRPPR